MLGLPAGADATGATDAVAEGAAAEADWAPFGSSGWIVVDALQPVTTRIAKAAEEANEVDIDGMDARRPCHGAARSKKGTFLDAARCRVSLTHHPMRLGIDLGTTRTVVAAYDRGNFPVVGFMTDDGDMQDHYPTVSAEVSGKLVHGLDAEAAERDGAPSLRSWKRILGQAKKDEPLVIGSVTVTSPVTCP